MLINQHSNDITLMGFINRLQFVCYEGRKEKLTAPSIERFQLAIVLEETLLNSNDCNHHNG